MYKYSTVLLGLSLAVCGNAVSAAQSSMEATASAPKYLQVIVEYTKPGKGGLAHDKTESAYVQAMKQAKFPIHYLGFNSMSGQSRAIYLAHFDSFDAMEQANKLLYTPAMAGEMERINMADGELLSEARQLIFSYVPELSYHSKKSSPQMRYLEARILHVRPGHGKEFEEMVKMWIALEDKIGSADHWGAYRIEYGDQIGSYVLLTSHASLAEIDRSNDEDPKFMAAMTDDDKKRMAELRSAALDADRYEFYAVNPAQSYAPDEFLTADPSFWKPKAAAKPMEKKEEPKK